MTAIGAFDARVAAALDELRAAGLLRDLRLPSGIDLVSNDYLGLSEHPYLLERMRTAIGELPAGSGGSRLLRGHHEAFDRVEERLAEFCGTESALLFGSGYAANIGLMQALVTSEDVVVSDELNHASLIDGIRLTKARTHIYKHCDVEDLERALMLPREGFAFVITESVFSMDGDLAPLEDIVSLAERHRAVVIVDEAHATGLYGEKGAGLVESLELRTRVAATVHTGGKSLGSGGAWVAGSRALRDLLINRARSFVFSTAPLPVLAAALDAALDVIAREPHRRAEVHRKAAVLRDALARGGCRGSGSSPILPVIVGGNTEAMRLQADLAAQGFDVRAIRPPSVPPGTARLRVTVRYPVADSDLLRFADCLSTLRRGAA